MATHLKLKEKGQVILILLLVMAVSLAIALAIVQRSLTDISTSTKVEESSRALSAAEAGIEKIEQLAGIQSTTVQFPNNNSSADVQSFGPIPAQHTALEYPPLGKEEAAHVWLADPDNSDADGSPTAYYTQNKLAVYWGNIPRPQGEIDNNKPALEINIFYMDTAYKVKKYLIEPVDSRRTSNNLSSLSDVSLFDTGQSGCSSGGYVIPTSFSSNRSFWCKATLLINGANYPGISKLIALRARTLYNPVSEAFAAAPLGACGTSCSLPPQASLFVSTGVSGDSQRRVQLFQLNKVVPFYLDYAIFSAGSLTKQ